MAYPSMSMTSWLLVLLLTTVGTVKARHDPDTREECDLGGGNMCEDAEYVKECIPGVSTESLTDGICQCPGVVGSLCNNNIQCQQMDEISICLEISQTTTEATRRKRSETESRCACRGTPSVIAWCQTDGKPGGRCDGNNDTCSKDKNAVCDPIAKLCTCRPGTDIVNGVCGSYGGLCDTGSKCPLDKNASCDLKTSMCICLADAAAFNGVCVLSKHH
ncbi:hypothetical protein DPMN_132877 [Dreissena polymorpha]|uniref:Uncharacterized protein n=1 Tax=Dreissena polymorpha TaxID=45954 RepID=A0A9D4JAG6_DREPO|nr:hypothetical protein DPMN_132877 [Dreissena polymorpha]